MQYHDIAVNNSIFLTLQAKYVKVKRSLFIVFACLFLIQVIFSYKDLLCELGKIPGLLQHYRKHRIEEKVTLWDFIEMHYGNTLRSYQHQQKEKEQHQNLPFGDTHHHCSQHVAFWVYMPAEVRISSTIDGCKEESSYYKYSISTPYLTSPFQPPRIG